MRAFDCSGEPLLGESLGFLCLLFFFDDPPSTLGVLGDLFWLVSDERGGDWIWWAVGTLGWLFCLGETMFWDCATKELLLVWR
jgi:hypothetical protein